MGAKPYPVFLNPELALQEKARRQEARVIIATLNNEAKLRTAIPITNSCKILGFFCKST